MPVLTTEPPKGVTDASILLPGGSSIDYFGYPVRTVDRLALRRLLIAHAFDRLDTLLIAYNDSVIHDYRLEYRLIDAYDAFAVSTKSLEPALTAWVEQQPSSAPALVARASYFVARGLNARGTKLAMETTNASFDLMDYYFRLALEDLNLARRLNPKTLLLYYRVMQIAPTIGNIALSQVALASALTIQPQSFLFRALFMNALQPRWGGSYDAMTRFAVASAPFASGNPRIAALRGFAALDSGRILFEAGRKVEAAAAFDRALASGDYWEFRYRRSRLRAEMGQLGPALEDISRALVQRPQNSSLLYERARIEYALAHAAPSGTDDRDYAQAFADIGLAIALDSANGAYRALWDSYRQSIPQFAPTDTR